MHACCRIQEHVLIKILAPQHFCNLHFVNASKNKIDLYVSRTVCAFLGSQNLAMERKIMSAGAKFITSSIQQILSAIDGEMWIECKKIFEQKSA
jgi:hypothetical protein